MLDIPEQFAAALAETVPNLMYNAALMMDVWLLSSR
jgi:hypothetical protein